jgi:hypothetical protein
VRPELGAPFLLSRVALHLALGSLYSACKSTREGKMTLADGRAGRKAPYAPVSALREFLTRMSAIGIPNRVDRNFIRRLNVAKNNEWSLLSALKFLEVIDDQGAPTAEYKPLQRSDRFTEVLRRLVEQAYAPLFELGGASMSTEDLRNYFKVSSSPSQSKNAARFFREVCDLAGIPLSDSSAASDSEKKGFQELSSEAELAGRSGAPILLLEAKARLLDKLPPPNPEWSAAEYKDVYERFLAILQNLDATR